MFATIFTTCVSLSLPNADYLQMPMPPLTLTNTTPLSLKSPLPESPSISPSQVRFKC